MDNADKMAVELVRRLFEVAETERCLCEVRDLVCALRGPDEDNYPRTAEDKENGTAWVRSRLMTDRMQSICGFSPRQVSSKEPIPEIVMEEVYRRRSYSHYWGHIRRAFSVFRNAYDEAQGADDVPFRKLSDL